MEQSNHISRDLSKKSRGKFGKFNDRVQIVSTDEDNTLQSPLNDNNYHNERD